MENTKAKVIGNILSKAIIEVAEVGIDYSDVDEIIKAFSTNIVEVVKLLKRDEEIKVKEIRMKRVTELLNKSEEIKNKVKEKVQGIVKMSDLPSVFNEIESWEKEIADIEEELTKLINLIKEDKTWI